MAVTFTRAPTVASGDPITAPQFATLAKAFNDRLASGLGDGPWRIFFYLFSLFRQVRNSDSTGTSFPSLGEFFEAYQNVDPTEYQWPLAGPGEAEGANLASVMNAFVFGAEAFGLDDEATRLAEFPWATQAPTPSEAWILAKSQRGAWDPSTGGIASPSFTAARAHWRIRYSRTSPHGNSYGGYIPTPQRGLDCADGSANYQIQFTSLVDGSVTSYGGTCSENSGDVAAVVTLPWAYYVIMYDGTVDILPAGEWVEGPYTGEGRLMKLDAEGLSRMLNNFAREFRGSDAQRTSSRYHLQNAFDFQRFLSGQYHLAPQAGTEASGSISAVYPIASISHAASKGALLSWSTGGTARGWQPSCVFASAFISATNLDGSVTLDVLDDEDVVDTITIQPGDSRIWFQTTPWTPTALAFRLSSQLQFKSGGGSIAIECTELMTYKPNVHDYAFFLRVATASSGTPDGVGTNETLAKEVSDAYWSSGCLWNINGTGAIEPKLAEVNSNAIWDAARRLSKCVRLIRRHEMWMPQAYAVEDGKSVLWFRRHVTGIAGAAPDAWDGIGPAIDRIVSGDIREGVRYQCRTTAGAVYNRRTYANGETFVGTGTSEYTGEVWELDGIQRTAPPGGTSNRWLLGVELKPYNISVSSIWKPDVVADYFPIQNRCHLDALDIGGDQSLRVHFAYGETASGRVRYPESPAGYNYATLGGSAFFSFQNVNGISCDPLDTVCVEDRRNFYKSCRIYEPDIEIESVVWEQGTGNDEILKVTLTGRLHHCDEAGASISRDSSTWDTTALRAEPYRSHENGLREYIIHQTKGEAPSWKIGDQAATGALQTLPDAPSATIYPTFRLTKLIPEPYTDGRYTPTSPRKTHFVHDQFTLMELYLRAMCEGYVDAETSAAYACQSGTVSLFDFKFDTLCLQAFGNKWFTSTVDDDNRQGHGPLPNTDAMAAIFNQYSAAVNLLDTVRVMLPCVMEKAVAAASISEPVAAYSGDGSVVACGGGGEVWRESLLPVPVPDLSTSVWEPAGGGHDIITSGILSGSCIGGSWEQITGRDAVRFRYAPSDEDLVYALPESWRTQFQDDQQVLVSIVKTHKIITREATANIADAEDCAGNKWPIDGSHWYKFPQSNLVDETVCQLTGATFTAPEIDSPSTLFRSSAGCVGGPEYRWSISVLSSTTASIKVDLV